MRNKAATFDEFLSRVSARKHSEAIAKSYTSKGAIRFQPNDPLPATLVKKLVKTRIRTNRYHD